MGLEHVLTLVPELTGDPIVIGESRRDYEVERTVWANEAFMRQTGFALEDLDGADPQLLHGNRLSDRQKHEIGQLVHNGSAFRGDLPCQRKDGTIYTADVSIVPWHDADSGSTFLVKVYRDVTDWRERQRRALEALTERDRLAVEINDTRARMALALDVLPSTFAVFDTDRRIVAFNQAYWRAFTAVPDEIKPGMHMVDIARIGIRNGKIADAIGREEEFIEHVRRDWLKSAKELEREFEPGHFERIIRARTAHGDMVTMRIDITDVKRQEQKLKSYSEALERANADIREQAIRDALTGVLNRRGHEMRLERLLGERSRGGHEVALLHVDLDRFKQINDAYGHGTGDEVLRHVAAILTELAGEKDCVARIGGDEFLISLPIREAAGQPVLLARQILGRLAAPFIHDARSCRVGASIGIAVTPLGGTTASELSARSDYALYQAKRDGRNRVRSFDRDMRFQVTERQSLSEELLAGLERGEIEPFYQLQVAAGSHDLHGAEALARWRHPERGLLAPDLFMPIAEELGVVAEIDRQIFLRAIEEMTAMCERGLVLPRLSFNVSTGRVSDRQLLADLDRNSRFPGQIVFELLESIFVEQADIGFLLTIDRLRDMGIGFEVDDFGSGHSSIIALTRIAPERLKIDSRLVAPIIGSDSAMRLVRAVADIGHALDIEVTAEGVETAAHADRLREIGCTVLQGYRFSRPVQAAEFERILCEGSWRGGEAPVPKKAGGGKA